MTTTIYCKKTCPICNQNLEMSKTIGVTYSCENECYRFYIGYSLNEIYIYRVSFSFFASMTKLEIEKEETRAQTEIDYWKKDDKYLVKILGRI